MIRLWLFFASVLPYLPALTAGYVFDDTWVLRGTVERLDYPIFKDWGFTWHMWRFDHRPVVQWLHILEMRLWDAPVTYHVVNLGIHTVNVQLAYTLVGHWTEHPFWAALVFAIHPLQVQSVGYIGARSGMLSTLFMFTVLYLMFLVPVSVVSFLCVIAASALAWKSKEDALALVPLVLALRWI